MPLKIEGLKEITRKLESLGDPKVFRRPMQQSVEHINVKMQKDPSKARGAFSALATPGQRRAYWAKVARGEARHSATSGYIRSGRLYRGWQTKIEANGRRGIIYNDVGYAGYVQGESQQPFHAVTRYPKDSKVAKEEGPKVVGFFEAEYARQLAK